MKSSRISSYLFLLIAIILYGYYEYKDYIVDLNQDRVKAVYKSNNIPNYNNKDIIILNNNEPNFDLNIDIKKSFELYGELDSLGRVTKAYSNIGYDLMPTEPRGIISYIKPTGFKIVKYKIIEDGLFLYNRCHLIAYQLTGENDNEKNLMTCTRHMNATLMEPYESRVGSYIRRTHNHVLYRVTPIFDNDNLVSRGVQIEALSLEDNGKGIKFNVFIYNVQPGIEIDYKTGDSKEIK